MQIAVKSTAGKPYGITSMVTEFGANQVPIFLKFGLVPNPFQGVLGRLLKIFRPFATCANVVEIRLISSIAGF